MTTGYKEIEMADIASTPAERLAQVREAKYKVLYGGQSYQIGSRKLTRADLALLNQMEKELEAELAAGETSMLIDDTYVAFFDGR
jgi:hypothetical protein